MRRMVPLPPNGDIETVDWQDIENKPELYNKNEIDLMLGNIDDILDSILGVEENGDK